MFFDIDENNVFLGGSEFARIVGSTKPQAIYWAKAGYLKSRNGEYHMFPLSQIRKGKIMALLVSKMGLSAKKGSDISVKFLTHLDSNPKAVKATLLFLDMLIEDFDKVFNLIIETGFSDEIMRVLV